MSQFITSEISEEFKYYTEVVYKLTNRVMNIYPIFSKDTSEIGFTTKTHDIYICIDHPLINRIDSIEEQRKFRMGVLVHELMHVMHSDFDLLERKMKHIPERERELFRIIANIVEDFSINWQAKELLMEWYRKLCIEDNSIQNQKMIEMVQKLHSSFLYCIEIIRESLPRIYLCRTPFSQYVAALLYLIYFIEKDSYKSCFDKETFQWTDVEGIISDSVLILFDVWENKSAIERLNSAKAMFEQTRILWQEFNIEDALSDIKNIISTTGISIQNNRDYMSRCTEFDVAKSQEMEVLFPEGFYELENKKKIVVVDYIAKQSHDIYQPVDNYGLLFQKNLERQLMYRLKEWVNDTAYGARKASSGKIDLSAYTSRRITTKLFKKSNSENGKMDLAVAIAVDCSGSMLRCNRYHLVYDLLTIFRNAFKHLGVPLYVMGFNDGKTKTKHYHFQKWKAIPTSVSSMLNIRFAERNLDSVAIDSLGRILKSYKAQKKLMLIISDNKPSSIWFSDGKQAYDASRNAVKTISKFANVIGIIIDNEQNELAEWVYSGNYLCLDSSKTLEMKFVDEIVNKIVH